MKRMPTPQFPMMRSQGLVIEDLPDEVLVYDLDRDEAHCLNRTAALVWRHCNGETGPTEIARHLQVELDAPCDEDLVWLALRQLRTLHLLELSVPAVLEQWQTYFNPNYRDMALAEVPTFLFTPRRLLAELAARWRHPIRATVEVRGAFNDWPRGPYQLAALLLRSPELPRQMGIMLWRRLRLLIKDEAITRLLLTDGAIS